MYRKKCLDLGANDNMEITRVVIKGAGEEGGYKI